jgi:acyl-CoA thioester hydrolase
VPVQGVRAVADNPGLSMTDLRPAPYSFPVRVYWEDTDAGGVVFYANYLKYFERARTEWLRSHGYEQQRMKDQHALMFVVTHTSTRYLRPARLDDQLTVTVAVLHAGRASMRVAQQAWRDQVLLAEGDIRIGCVHSGTFRPERIPNDILQAIA